MKLKRKVRKSNEKEFAEMKIFFKRYKDEDKFQIETCHNIDQGSDNEIEKVSGEGGRERDEVRNEKIEKLRENIERKLKSVENRKRSNLLIT